MEPQINTGDSGAIPPVDNYRIGRNGGFMQSPGRPANIGVCKRHGLATAHPEVRSADISDSYSVK